MTRLQVLLSFHRIVRQVDLGLALVVVGAIGLSATKPASSVLDHSGGLVPSRLTARSAVTRHFEYVFGAGGIQVYDIDRRNRYLGQIAFPDLPIRGLVADPAKATLFVSFGGAGGSAGTGSMLAYDLVSGRTLWRRDYSTGVDNIAITPNGRKIYMAVGEASSSTTWEIVDAANGRITGSIQGGSGPHGDDRQEDRASERAWRPAFHDQRGPDPGVHNVLELPWLSGQQHQDRKGSVHGLPAGFSFRCGNVRQHS